MSPYVYFVGLVPDVGSSWAHVCFPGGVTPCRHTCAPTARPPACRSLILPGGRVCALEPQSLRGPCLPGPRTAGATTGFPCCRALAAAHWSLAPRSSSITSSVGCAARPRSAGLLPQSFTCLLLSSRLCPASLGCIFYFLAFPHSTYHACCAPGLVSCHLSQGEAS